MSGSLPPLEHITADNSGPAVVAVGYSLIVTTIVFASIRVISLLKLKREFGLDDAILILAVLIGLAETITINKAADYGLGKFIHKLTPDQLNGYYKYSYASDILAILAMGCTKFSVLHLMSRLSQQGMQKFYPSICAVIGTWTLFSVFAVAFECGATKPWVYTPAKCAGKGALWYPIIITNILTDAVLAGLFAPIAWKLQMALSQRITVASLFGVRLLVSVAAVAQLAVLAPALHKQDQTRARSMPAILGQVVMNLAILTATIPSLHRFLTELQTARMGAQIPTTQYELSQGSGQHGTWKSAFSKYGKGTNNKSQKSEKFDQSNNNSVHGKPRIVDFRPDLYDKNQAHIQHDPANLAETGSRTSDGSQDMIIRQTVAWDIQHYEENEPSPEVPVNSRAHSQHHAM